jgi:hypothetical protein
MTYPAPEGEGQISRVHRVALCKEIGERLGAKSGSEPGSNVAAFDDAHGTIARWAVQNPTGSKSVKDFSHASFPPATIGIMTLAMESALKTLPHPVGSARVQSVAETILRSAKEGERDPAVLARMALLELLISPRDWSTLRAKIAGFGPRLWRDKTCRTAN